MTTTSLQTEIESRLASSEPEVEVLLVQVGGPAHPTLRLFIDHPDGVTLDLCERVSGLLNDYRDTYSVEVSSPGQDRPLTKPDHYTRFLGRQARVRLRDGAETGLADDAAAGVLDGHRSVTGELVGASERDVTIAAGEGIVTIPYDNIARSNLIPGD